MSTGANPLLSGSFATGTVPTGIAVSAGGKLVVVASQDGAVTLHDGDNGTVLNRFTMPGSPFRVIISRDGLRAYALSSSGNLLVVDLVRRAAQPVIATGLTSTNGLVESLDGSTVYVSSMAGGVTAVNVSGASPVKNFNITGTLQDLALSDDGGDLYVADEMGGIVDFRLADGFSRRIQTDPSFGLSMTPDGSQLWITQPASGRILVVDRAEFIPLRTIAIPAGPRNSIPRRVMFDAAGNAVVSDESGFVHIFH